MGGSILKEIGTGLVEFAKSCRVLPYIVYRCGSYMVLPSAIRMEWIADPPVGTTPCRMGGVRMYIGPEEDGPGLGALG